MPFPAAHDCPLILDELIGPIVYEMPISAAKGRTLADYEVVRIPVHLSAEEQARYDQLSRQVRAYMIERRKTDPHFQWEDVCQETAATPEARRVLKAYFAKKSIEDRAEEKLRVLEDLFRLHAHEPCLVFAGSNAMARDVSQRFLIPCLLNHCGKKERLDVLRGLEERDLSGLGGQPGAGRGRGPARGEGGHRDRRHGLQPPGQAAAGPHPAEIGERPGGALRNRHGRYERGTAARGRGERAMLTRELAIAAYDAGRILPDRLLRKTHRPYLDYAERMLAVYRDGVGRTRRELHRAVQAVFAEADDCPTRRIEAFCKLLDERATYQQDRGKRAAALRREVFRMAAPLHPLVRKADRLFEHEEVRAKREIAARLGRPWKEIEQELFADVIEFHRLAAFEGYPDGVALLARYNVAQVQAALYGAVSMTVWAGEDFKTIVRYAKLARLMHTIVRSGEGRYTFPFRRPGLGAPPDAPLRGGDGPLPAGAVGLPGLADARGGPHPAAGLEREPRPVVGRRAQQPPAGAGGVRFQRGRGLCREMGRRETRRLAAGARRRDPPPEAEGFCARFRFPPRRRPHGADGDRRLLDAGVPRKRSWKRCGPFSSTASCWPSPGPRRRPRRKRESSLPCRGK